MAVVKTEICDGVLTLTLDSPAERNSLTADNVSELLQAMDSAEADSGVGAVIWLFSLKWGERLG